MTVKLILADEQPLHRLGFSQFLSGYPEFEVTASCATAEDALQAVHAHRPDLLVLDLHLPGMGAPDLLRAMHSEGLAAKVVILTASVNEDEVLDLIRLGVRGVVLKSMAPELLIKCLRIVYAGGEWLEKRSVSLALEKLLRHESQKQLRAAAPLTAREMELLCLAAQGVQNQEIAARLFISQGTVKSHLHKIYQKLQVKNRIALSTLARENGWI